MNGLDRSANKLSSESLVFAMNQNTIPKISVMIPCYNNSAFIEQAIRSVLDQKVDADVELVMIDDASTDSSVSIIESLCDARIRLLRNESNRGISAVRNQLLGATRGQFITSLDGDDYYLSDTKLATELDRILSASDPSKSVAYSDVELIDSSGQTLARASRMAAPQEGIIFQGMLDRRIMIPRDFLVSRELAMSVGGFDETLSIYEDWDYKLRLAQKAAFLYTGELGIGYRRHGGGLSAANASFHGQQIAMIRRKYCMQAFDGDPMNLLKLAGRIGNRMAKNRAA